MVLVSYRRPKFKNHEGGVMSQEEHSDKKQAADNFAEMFRAFGQAISEIFNDPELKEKAKGFTESTSASAKTLANRFKDEEVKAKFRDVGKAAQVFGRSVADAFKDDKRSKKHFTIAEAKQIGEALGIDWSKFAIEQYRMGLDVELEHGKVDQHTNVTNDEPIMTGKIALAHLNEFPDYYTRLNRMEEEAEWKL
jgi:hypothetical protein